MAADEERAVDRVMLRRACKDLARQPPLIGELGERADAARRIGAPLGERRARILQDTGPAAGDCLNELHELIGTERG
jgi:hypothetical protein